MIWFIVIISILAYLVIGGAVKKLCDKIEVTSTFLVDWSPFVIVMVWPLLILAGVFIFVVIGSAQLGEVLMDWLFKLFEHPEEEEDKK